MCQNYALYLIADPIVKKHQPNIKASKMEPAAESNDSPTTTPEMGGNEESGPLTPEGGSGSTKTSPKHLEQGNH